MSFHTIRLPGLAPPLWAFSSSSKAAKTADLAKLPVRVVVGSAKSILKCDKKKNILNNVTCSWIKMHYVRGSQREFFIQSLRDLSLYTKLFWWILCLIHLMLSSYWTWYLDFNALFRFNYGFHTISKIHHKSLQRVVKLFWFKRFYEKKSSLASNDSEMYKKVHIVIAHHRWWILHLAHLRYFKFILHDSIRDSTNKGADALFKWIFSTPP